MKQVITTQTKPIKLWLDNCEAGAMQQAYNVIGLPCLYEHLALMPDCLTDDTEILTDTGFVLIKDLQSDTPVCNYDVTTGKVFFAPPSCVIDRPRRRGERIYGFTNCNTDKRITVSENHRMPFIGSLGTKAKDVAQITAVKDFLWGGAGNVQTDYDISDELLCLIAWIVGDGNIKRSPTKEDGTYASVNIRFGLTKQRKILRIRSLLDALEIKHSVRTTEKQTTISVMVAPSRELLKLVGEDKRYPTAFITRLSTRQALLFLEECVKVDGDWTAYQNYNTIRYNTSREADVDFLSALIAMHVGVASDNTRYTRGYKRIKMHILRVIPHNTLTESNNGMHKTVIRKDVIDYDGNLVCVTCDSGFFIARQNGMTFVSGNCHQGYGMPIGGVAALDGAVSANMVGVDIGCGMVAVETNLVHVDKLALKTIMGKMREIIPVGFKHQESQQAVAVMPEPSNQEIVLREFESARKQIGTLGGGNHFIDLLKGGGHIWIMIHSGSRNLGLQVAQHYNRLAKDLNPQRDFVVPKSWDLAYFPTDIEEAQKYIAEMQYCVDFAYASRKLMMDRTLEIFADTLPCVTHEPMINIAHNYASLEHHFGKNVWVHRKGATSARKGELGIIPGSQGTKSYIVKGLGNPESFNSCSHGAGRTMSRSKAKEKLDFAQQKKLLDDQGIVHGMRTKKDLDEAPGAYKDIAVVMENQADLVEIVTELSPIANIKG